MPTVDDYRWLVSEAARPWLRLVREELSGGLGGNVRLTTRLRRDLSAARVHLVLEQVDLRQRARVKFSSAEQMFFTRKGLEQATDESIAAYKARRFGAGVAVADLCCGIGGDLIALAGRGGATGVDSDRIAALLAEVNAHASSEGVKSLSPAGTFPQGESISEQDSRPRVPPVHVDIGDATAFPLANVAAWHIDPDRRPQGRRTTCIDLYQPPLEAIELLIAANANASIKLAPAAQTPAAWNEAAEHEWLGSRGECRQQVAWFGSLAQHAGLRAATVVDALGGPRTIVGRPSESLPVAPSVGRFLYEPHAAVLAAKLTGALCDQYALAAVSPGIAYFTGDNSRAADDPALDTFEVRDVLPLDRKQLAAYCREHRLGRLEVKKRGVQIDPERLRKEVLAAGDEAATLLVAPIGGNVRVIVAQRRQGTGGRGQESGVRSQESGVRGHDTN